MKRLIQKKAYFKDEDLASKW